MYLNSSVNRVVLFSERIRKEKEEIAMFELTTYLAPELRVTEQCVLYDAKSRPLSDCSPRHVLGGVLDGC